MRAYEQLNAWEEIGISSDDKEKLTRQITVSSAYGPSTSKTGGRTKLGTLDGFLSLEQEKNWDLSVNSDEI